MLGDRKRCVVRWLDFGNGYRVLVIKRRRPARGFEVRFSNPIPVQPWLVFGRVGA